MGLFSYDFVGLLQPSLERHLIQSGISLQPFWAQKRGTKKTSKMFWTFDSSFTFNIDIRFILVLIFVIISSFNPMKCQRMPHKSPWKNSRFNKYQYVFCFFTEISLQPIPRSPPRLSPWDPERFQWPSPRTSAPKARPAAKKRWWQWGIETYR